MDHMNVHLPPEGLEQTPENPKFDAQTAEETVESLLVRLEEHLEGLSPLEQREFLDAFDKRYVEESRLIGDDYPPERLKRDILIDMTATPSDDPAHV